MAIVIRHLVNCLETINRLPTQLPSIQNSVDEHSSFTPHLHCPAVHVSTAFPLHFSSEPQLQMLDSLHVSDAPEQ